MASFVLPLLVWAAVSYMPFLWHPLIEVRDPGEVPYFHEGALVKKEVFAEQNAKMRATGLRQAAGVAANPVFLPAPHEVAVSLYQSFQTPPKRKGEPWLHESLFHSIRIIFWGFLWSSLIGVPLGVLCGVFGIASKLTEPVVDFTRYMPAPAFGALSVAILGIHDAPKIAIIVFGTFFQQVLVIANTTRKMDFALIEAAQTLGAGQLRILTSVVVPAIIVDLYNDMRILLGWAWTYLIVGEYVGVSSGITYFINQQSKYRIYDNVIAAILLIGIIGFTTDRILAWLGNYLFPWHKSHNPGLLRRWLRERAAPTRS